MSGPCYVGVIPGWLVHDEQGRLVAVIEQPPPMWPVYRVHAIDGTRWLGNRVLADEALALAGARRADQ